MEVSPVYGTKDEPWLLPRSALKAVHGRAAADSSGGRRVAYNEAYPTQDFFVVRKVYSNEFDLVALEEVLKIQAFNVGMAYVVD